MDQWTDIILLQEIKAWPDQLDDEILNYRGYKSYWHEATKKKGYSGVAIYSKQEPLHVEYGIGIEKYDIEGRFLRADFEDFSVQNGSGGNPLSIPLKDPLTPVSLRKEVYDDFSV